ncbi:MAG: TetR/AcrR family transcriptional regulator [Solimonas sp.]
MTGIRSQKKDALRNQVADELIALIAEGRLDLSHDLVAERTGISRRTLYRYFPNQESLMQAAWQRVTEQAGPKVTFPQSERDLIDQLPDIYRGFDEIAPIATLVRSTPQGRAIRLSQKKKRVESYTAAAADAVRQLPPKDRKLATAMLQVLHTTPWLEMRDHWDLSGEQIAEATGWAMRTLLADLRKRKGKPLSESA